MDFIHSVANLLSPRYICTYLGILFKIGISLNLFEGYQWTLFDKETKTKLDFPYFAHICKKENLTNICKISYKFVTNESYQTLNNTYMKA
jgi:hypothetical protein